jgi:hypothetical protein
MSQPRHGRELRYEVGERDGIKVAIRLIELSGDDARRLRRHQLEAVIWLLRRAQPGAGGQRNEAS